MGAESGFRPRPGQEKHAAFRAGLPGLPGTPGNGNGERRGREQPFSVDRPIDLVGNIRALVQQERARQGRQFNAAWWLRSEMKSMYELARVKHDPQETQQSIADLRIAWQLRAYQPLEDYRKEVYHDIRGWRFGRDSIIISPLGVTLLDAMAEAIGIEHTPGQATFDTSLFRPPSIEKLKAVQTIEELAPTNEEVRNAITPKKTT